MNEQICARKITPWQREVLERLDTGYFICDFYSLCRIYPLHRRVARGVVAKLLKRRWIERRKPYSCPYPENPWYGITALGRSMID